MAQTVAGARPLSETWGGTRTTLRPDYEAMISSGYDLQTAQNRRAMSMLGQDSQTQLATHDWLTQFYGQFQQKTEDVTRKQEQRYSQMLGIADVDYGRQRVGFNQMLGTIGQETGQRISDIRGQTERRVASEEQRLGRMGLSNTSQVGSVLGRGIRREGEAEINRYRDLMLGRKLGVQRSKAEMTRGTRLGIMERRTDQYPDQQGMMQLISQMYEGTGALPRLR